MKKYLLIIPLLLLLVAAAAYLYLSGKEQVIRISEAELQHALDEKLPLTKRYFFIIDVTLKNPRVHLQEGSDRVNAGLDIGLNLQIDKDATPLGGSIDISGGITYSPKNGAFYLVEPVIENIELQGLSEKRRPKVAKAITLALTEYFSENPIYTLKRGDLKQAAARLTLKKISVASGELVVVLGI